MFSVYSRAQWRQVSHPGVALWKAFVAGGKLGIGPARAALTDNSTQATPAVRFEGEEGVITRVDHDEYVVWVDFAQDDSMVNGEMDVSPDEPDLEFATEETDDLRD